VHRRALVCVAAFVATLGSVIAPVSLISGTAAASTTSAAVDPAYGQYIPLSTTVILDTRNTIGGAQGAIGSGQSVTVPVTGVGAVPAAGVTAVFVNIEILSASASGFLTDYASDQPNPVGASVSFYSGLAVSGSDVLTVGGQYDPTQYGDVTFKNNSSGTIQLAVQVEGYFTDGTQGISGDSYFGVPWNDQVDTRSGLGVPNGNGANGGPVGKLQPGASLTVSVKGPNGIPYGGVSAADIDAMDIEIGALNASAYGFLNVEGANTNTANDNGSQLRTLAYQPGLKARLTDVVQIGSSQTFTIVNNGSAAIDVQIVISGYFLNSTADSVPGSEYLPLDNNQQICDTRVGCPFGGTTRYRLAANASINVQETGVDGIPSTGVSAVAAEIDAVNPSAAGWLTVNPYGSAPAFSEPFNFAPNDNTALFDNSVVTQTGSNGAITITNSSSGSVDVVVSARGYWLGASVPDAPQNPDATYDGTNANLTWDAPSSDGGSAISSYVLNFTSGLQVSVPASQNTASVATVSTDQFSVVAVNAMGAGQPSSEMTVQGADPTGASSAQIVADGQAYLSNLAASEVPMQACQGEPNPAPAGTISGLVEYNGSPLASETVDVVLEDTTGGSASYPHVTSVVSDASGCFWLTLPDPSSIDPSAALAELGTVETANAGNANLLLESVATAVSNGVNYPLSGTVVVSDSANPGGNAGELQPVVNLYPSGGNTVPSGGTVVAQIGRRGDRIVKATHKLESAATAARTLAAAPRTQNVYGFDSSIPYSPYAINGANLSRAAVISNTRSAANVGSQGLALMSFSHQSRRQQVQGAIARVLRRGGRRGHMLVPNQGGGGTSYPSCFNQYAVQGQTTPSGAQCEYVCADASILDPTGNFVWTPLVSTHMYAPGESGEVKAGSGTANMTKISADVSAFGGAVTVSGGWEHSKSSTVTKSYGSPWVWSGQRAANLDIPYYYSGAASEIGCMNIMSTVDPAIPASHGINGEGYWDISDSGSPDQIDVSLATTMNAYANVYGASYFYNFGLLSYLSNSNVIQFVQGNFQISTDYPHSTFVQEPLSAFPNCGKHGQRILPPSAGTYGTLWGPSNLVGSIGASSQQARYDACVADLQQSQGPNAPISQDALPFTVLYAATPTVAQYQAQLSRTGQNTNVTSLQGDGLSWGRLACKSGDFWAASAQLNGNGTYNPDTYTTEQGTSHSWSLQVSLGIPFNPAARVTVSYEHKWTWNSGTTEMIRSGTDPNATYWYWGDLLTNQVGTPSPSDGAFFSGGRGSQFSDFTGMTCAHN